MNGIFYMKLVDYINKKQEDNIYKNKPTKYNCIVLKKQIQKCLVKNDELYNTNDTINTNEQSCIKLMIIFSDLKCDKK
jgi:hypothetical protein